MTSTEGYLLLVTVAGLALWTRACAKRSVSSCALALVLGAVAAAAYFVVFSLTRTQFFAVWLLAPFLVVLLMFHRWARTTPGKVMAAIVILLVGGAALAEYKLVSMGNALLVIEPYRAGKMWKFDEPRLRLRAEPFVQGIPEMIDKMAEGIPVADKSIRLIFSQRPFPGWQQRLDLRRAEAK